MKISKSVSKVSLIYYFILLEIKTSKTCHLNIFSKYLKIWSLFCILYNDLVIGIKQIFDLICPYVVQFVQYYNIGM